MKSRPPPACQHEQTVRDLCLEIARFRAAIGHHTGDAFGRFSNDFAIDDIRRAYRAMGGQPLPDPADEACKFTAHSPD